MLVSRSTSLNIGLMSKHFYFDNKLAHRIWFWLSKGSRRLQETKQIFQLELLLNLRGHVFWSNLLHPREIIIMVIKILHRFLFQFFCNLRCDGGKYLNVEGNVSFTDLPTNSLPIFFFFFFFLNSCCFLRFWSIRNWGIIRRRGRLDIADYS